MKRLLFFISLLPLLVCAQNQSITSAGDNVKLASKLVSWSIGNTITGSSSTPKYIIAQGTVLGAYQVFYENKKGSLNIACSPNPATNFIKVQLLTNHYENYSWMLFNLNGKIIKQGDVTSDIIRIELSPYESSSFFISIFDENHIKVASAKLLKL